MDESKEHDWKWYAEKICRDMGICDFSHPGAAWGYEYCKQQRAAEIAVYYENHHMYPFDVRKMLLNCMYGSLECLLEVRSMSQSEEACLLSATRRAMADVYDRDVVSDYWEDDPGPHEELRVSLWIKRHFSDWRPPPSIWYIMLNK